LKRQNESHGAGFARSPPTRGAWIEARHSPEGEDFG
jgi:hypothetical protein